MSEAERQARWRERQKALGEGGRKHGIKGLTKDECDFLKVELAKYRQTVTPVTPEPVAPEPVTPVTPDPVAPEPVTPVTPEAPSNEEPREVWWKPHVGSATVTPVTVWVTKRGIRYVSITGDAVPRRKLTESAFEKGEWEIQGLAGHRVFKSKELAQERADQWLSAFKVFERSAKASSEINVEALSVAELRKIISREHPDKGGAGGELFRKAMKVLDRKNNRHKKRRGI